MKSNKNIKDIPAIILSNLGQESDIKRGLEFGATGQLLKKILVDSKLISQKDFNLAKKEATLRKVKIDRRILEIIPEIVAKKQGIIAFDKTKDGLKLAMENPENLEIREFLERKTGLKVIPYFATKRDLKEALKFYKKEIKEEFEELVGKTLEEFEKKREEPEALRLPVIKIVDLILNYGYENRASDIHIEPY